MLTQYPNKQINGEHGKITVVHQSDDKCALRFMQFEIEDQPHTIKTACMRAWGPGELKEQQRHMYEWVRE